MPNGLNLRDAGAAIAESGLTEDVKRIDENDIGSREAVADAEDVNYDADESQESTPNTADDENVDEPNEVEGDEGDEVNPDEEPESDETQLYDVNINGEKTQVDLEELTRGYQREGDYQQKTQALVAHTRELTGAHTQAAQQYQQAMGQANAVINSIRDMLIGDVNSVEMEQLKIHNPQQYMMERQNMADRVNAIDGLINQLTQEYGAQIQQQQQHMQAQIQQQRQLEAQLVQKAIPYWSEEADQNLATYLNQQGFQPQEIQSVIDHRIFIVAEKARLYDEMMSKAPTKGRKTVPKAVKAGSNGQVNPKAAKSVKKWSSYRKAKQKAKQTGNMRDAGAAIAKML